MNVNVNKNISVWRGNNTPPTGYHFWIKEDGSQWIQNKDEEWVEIYTPRTEVDALNIEEVEPSGDTILTSYELHDINGNKRGVTIDIPKDQTIRDVKISTLDATLDEDGMIVDGTGTTTLCISYILADGSYKLVSIDYQKFLEETEFGDGTEVVNHKVQVKIDPTTDSYLTVGPDGLKLSGVADGINDLAESIYYYHASATISASPTLIEKGVSTQITITAKSSFKTESANTLDIKNVTSDQTLESSGTPASKTATINIDDSATFQAIAAFDYDVTKTADVTVTAKYPIYTFGSTNSTVDSSTITAGTKYVKSNASGSYSINLSQNLMYFWICVPNDMLVNKVTLSGFDVPMEVYQTISVTGKGDYKCYRSSNTNDSGTYTLVVS